MMLGGRNVATITPTDTGLRLVSHGRTWAKPQWSKKQPNGLDVDFAPKSSIDH
jgi:hypothetical protein